MPREYLNWYRVVCGACGMDIEYPVDPITAMADTYPVQIGIQLHNRPGNNRGRCSFGDTLITISLIERNSVINAQS